MPPILVVCDDHNDSGRTSLEQVSSEGVLFMTSPHLDKKLNKYILCSDDARFFNHSKAPNTKEVKSEDGYGITVTLKDIHEGEEITCDYEVFDFKYDHTF